MLIAKYALFDLNILYPVDKLWTTKKRNVYAMKYFIVVFT